MESAPIENTVSQTEIVEQLQPIQSQPDQKKLIAVVVAFGVVAFILAMSIGGGIGWWRNRSPVTVAVAGSQLQEEQTQLTSDEAPLNIESENVLNSSSIIDESTPVPARWENTREGGWLPISGIPGNCQTSILSPIDISKATHLLPPGQERQGDFKGAGGNYKPHGGFRFDGLQPGDVQVVSPISGYVYRAGNYLMNGEVQYTIDIIDPCGMMVRLGHLKTLSAPLQELVKVLPTPAEGDSRTQKFTNYPEVKAGDVIATAVGFDAGPNVFFDFGVYDLRKQNVISQTQAYQAAQKNTKELSWYAVCWYDLLPSGDAERVKSLPAGDAISGKQSDYCK